MYTYTITPKTLAYFMQIEGIKEKIASSLIHRSVQPSFAITKIQSWTKENMTLTERMIHRLHALGKKITQLSEISFVYRKNPITIRDSITNSTLYIPPDPSDIPSLMTALINWVHRNRDLPVPLTAAIAQYQFQAITPFDDENDQTSRLFATLILSLGGYGLNGLYSLDQIYDRNPMAYEKALYKNRPHNYYLGDTKLDITPWIEFFIESIIPLFESLASKQSNMSLKPSNILRTLDPKERKVLLLFKKYATLTAEQIGTLFDLQPRTRAILCKQWTEKGFLEIANPSNKRRTYKLSTIYENLIENQS